MIKLTFPCLKITSSLIHKLNFRRAAPGVMVFVDSEDQVKKALRIPMSDESFGASKVVEAPSCARSKASRSSVYGDVFGHWNDGDDKLNCVPCEGSR